MQRDHFPFLKASGFSSIAAFSRLLSLGVHTQAFLPLLPVRSNMPPFLLFLMLLFCSLLSTSLLYHLLVLCLPPQQFCIHSLSSGLISVSIHSSKSQSGGEVYKKCNCYKTKKSCKMSYNTNINSSPSC